MLDVSKVPKDGLLWTNSLLALKKLTLMADKIGKIDESVCSKLFK